MKKPAEKYTEFFFDLIETKEGLDLLLSEIEEVEKVIFSEKQSSSFTDKISQAISEALKLKIADLESLGVLNDPESQKEFFSKLKKDLASLPVLRITLAFEPSREFISKMSSWLEKAKGQKILLDINVEDGIVGGAIVEFGGEYRDYSVRKKLNEVLEMET